MDELEAIGDPELRSALLFARGAARPVTADALAAAQGVHRNVARSRLERLAEAGLLVPAYERRSGRSGPGAGRPAKTYAVAPERIALQFPGRRYEALLTLLIDAVPAKQLHGIGVAFGEELARASGLKTVRQPQRAFENVCAAVRRLGYQATLESADENNAVISTPVCLLRPLVRAKPAAAEVDRGMWAGLAAHALSGSAVRHVACETHDCLTAHAPCRVRLSLRKTH
jgi:predicted ArsR family transcriptional regulator